MKCDVTKLADLISDNERDRGLETTTSAFYIAWL